MHFWAGASLTDYRRHKDNRKQNIDAEPHLSLSILLLNDLEDNITSHESKHGSHESRGGRRLQDLLGGDAHSSRCNTTNRRD